MRWRLYVIEIGVVLHSFGPLDLVAEINIIKGLGLISSYIGANIAL